MKQWESEKEREEQMPYAQFFHSIWGMKTAVMEVLLEEYGSPEQIFHARQEELEILIGEKRAKAIDDGKKKKDVWGEWEKLWEKGISFISRLDPAYPEKLKEIPDAPFGIYAKGRLPDKFERSVAIVGARRCTQYGAHMAVELGKGLARAGIPVISGMAKGIDGISQEAVVNAGGITFAVLGCGVDVCYPSTNRELYRKIQDCGGILSEYPPGTAPRPELFPPRNRIISGLSDTVVVVEAGQKSGTLITVDMALEQGREIYCVPGRATDRLSEGCNRLIGQGAGILFSVDDFLEKFGENCHRKNKTSGTAGMSKEEKALYELLDFEPVSVEQLHIQLASQRGMESLSLQDVMDTLLNLILMDKAENISASFYAKKR